MSADPKSVSNDCCAIVFYGVQTGAKAAGAFYRTVVGWFGELGFPPDKLATHGVGHTGKLGSFDRGNAKLLKAGFEGIKGVSVVSTTPNAITWGHDYFLTASLDSEIDSLFCLLVARSSLATLSAASMLPISSIIANELKPA